MPWRINRETSLAVALIPKAGIQSFGAWLDGFDDAADGSPELLAAETRVAFFREPITRLRSAYSFIYWLQRRPGRGPTDCIPTQTWETFVDYALEHDDIHYRSQVQIVGDIPNVYHRFENLHEHWEKYWPGFMPWMNKTTRRPTTDYRTDDLMQHYALDLRIWAGAS